jgi:hypothetical protein
MQLSIPPIPTCLPLAHTCFTTSISKCLFHCVLQAIKSIERNGLEAMAAEAGINLWKLPFEDARPERLAYLAENKGKVPVVSSWTYQHHMIYDY